MKIAIPTSDGYRISSNVKRIKGFKIYEIVNSEVVKEQFLAKADSNGVNGNGNGNINGNTVSEEQQLLSDIMDCQIVLSNGFGKIMFEELLKARKEVFITEATDARCAIRHFIKQTLQNHPEMADI